MPRILISAALAAVVAASTVHAQTTNRQAPANEPAGANAQTTKRQAPANEPAGVNAQTTKRQAPANEPAGANAQVADGQAPINDELFAQVAAESGMGEVAVSEIGERKATDPQLKEFSRQMVADHRKLNQELEALAARKGIALPKELDFQCQFTIHSLGGETKENFDRCYAKAQLVSHMEAVSAFEAEAERGQDPELKALAAKALPKIKEHLSMLKPIAEKYEGETPDQHQLRDQTQPRDQDRDQLQNQNQQRPRQNQQRPRQDQQRPRQDQQRPQ